MLLGVHTQRDITTRQQVIQGLDRIAWNLLLVVKADVAFTYAPQCAATIVVIGQGDQPGVFINKEVTLRVDMALACLHVALYFPNAVQLETRVVGVDVARLQNVFVFDTRLAQLAADVRMPSDAVPGPS